MHNNYYVLKKLTSILEEKLIGTVLSQCFSQNKDELILQFETNGEPFFIKADLSPAFSCITFPSNFARARKNSVDLFPEIVGERVKQIIQYKNERSFSIVFSSGRVLLFKMHGNQSNLILFDQNGGVITLFKNILRKDKELTLTLDREIDWSYETFLNHGGDLKKLYFTFGKHVWAYLESIKIEKLTSEAQWKSIIALTEQLDKPSVYYIIDSNGSIVFSLLNYGNLLEEHLDLLNALNSFHAIYNQLNAFNKEKSSLLKQLNDRLSSSLNYVAKLNEKKQQLGSGDQYKVWADVLMANLNEIKQGTKEVTLRNFYNENLPITIKLKSNLSAQKNAELFYKKSKNQVIELSYLDKGIRSREEEIEEIQTDIERITATTSLSQLRATAGPLKKTKKPGNEKTETLPYNEFLFKGYKIWVGKNAAANDELTLKFSYKEDLWLHAKDVSGSHVLIKHRAGQNFPKDVIDHAASLAAYYSKRKNEGLVPIIVTPKKFVRKRKGAVPGAVIVEREQILIVEPRSHNN